MSEDLVTRLRKELEQKQTLLAQTRTEVRQLRLAISAIEQDNCPQPEDVIAASSGDSDVRSIVRRGELRRALLDCMRSGIVQRRAFDAALKDRGIVTTSNSISNALNRMSNKREIRWDPERSIYLINEKGPDTEVTRPFQSNGAAVGPA